VRVLRQSRLLRLGPTFWIYLKYPKLRNDLYNVSFFPSVNSIQASSRIAASSKRMVGATLVAMLSFDKVVIVVVNVNVSLEGSFRILCVTGFDKSVGIDREHLESGKGTHYIPFQRVLPSSSSRHGP
jgi:hypothetical protein